MPPAQATYSVADEADLTLLGYIAFLDPPKETCAAALAALKASGVQVKILTGDNDIVTRKICHEVGLPVDRIVLGSEIDDVVSRTSWQAWPRRPQCLPRSRRHRRRQSSMPCIGKGTSSDF